MFAECAGRDKDGHACTRRSFLVSLFPRNEMPRALSLRLPTMNSHLTTNPLFRQQPMGFGIEGLAGFQISQSFESRSRHIDPYHAAVRNRQSAEFRHVHMLVGSDTVARRLSRHATCCRDFRIVKECCIHGPPRAKKIPWFRRIHLICQFPCKGTPTTLWAVANPCKSTTCDFQCCGICVLGEVCGLSVSRIPPPC